MTRSATAAPDQFALSAHGVQRVYGSTLALRNANLEVLPGEIHALLGENGAGKSTLVRILAGLETADAGEARLWDEPMRGRAGASPRELGVAFIHQDLGLVETMSVSENIALGGRFPTRWGFVNQSRVRAQAIGVFDQLSVYLDVDRPVGELPPADQAIVAIARALCVGARLIVLDEPTARLHASEVRSLFGLLTHLRDAGVACLLITHRLDQVLEVCDRVTVLRDGETVGVYEASALSSSDLVSLIVGEHREFASEQRSAGELDEPILTLRGLAGVGFGPVTLDVLGGEIVGLTGLADAGHNELALALAGAAPIVSGTIEVDGREVTSSGSQKAMLARGIVYVAADRRADGLAMGLTATENLFLTGFGSETSKFCLRPTREQREAQSLLEEFGVRPPDPEKTADTFSGGNQQKIVLARSFVRGPRVLVLHEPTAAVDVGARFDIYEQLRDRCTRDGCGALVVTSDMQEAVNLLRSGCRHAARRCCRIAQRSTE